MRKAVVYIFCFLNFIFVAIAQKNFQIKYQNRPRNFIVFLPHGFSASENLPLVINMHGFTTTCAFQMEYSQFNRTADSVRCVTIYPEGVDLRWNSGTFFGVSSTVDDVGFLGELMDRAAILYNANMKKVFSMGYSAGGFMSYKLACDATNRVAAIAPDVASMVFDNLNSCVPARPIHMSVFNGLADPVTSYTGIPGQFPGIDSVKHFWQIKNTCDVVPETDTLPDLRNDGTKVVRYTYQNCSQGVKQVFYKVINGGHVWPGANDNFAGILGKTTQDVSMNNESWNFFKDKEVPESVQCDAPSNLVPAAVAADSFLLSWDAVPGVSNYKVGLADDSDKVTFYETSATSLSVQVDPARMVKWNVASLCSSGYHNWTTTRPLNFATSIRTHAVRKISVYPNPAKDALYVEIPGNNSTEVKFAIYNVLGAEVVSSSAVLPGNKIDIGELAYGFYQLMILKGDKLYSASFLKQ